MEIIVINIIRKTDLNLSALIHLRVICLLIYGGSDFNYPFQFTFCISTNKQGYHFDEM